MHLFCFPVPPFCDIILTYLDLHQATLYMAIAAAACWAVMFYCIAMSIVLPVWLGQAGSCSRSFILFLRAQGSLFQLVVSQECPGNSLPVPSALSMGHMFYSKNVYVRGGQVGQWSIEP